MDDGVVLADRGIAGAQAIRRATDVLRAVGRLQTRGATLQGVSRLTSLSTSTAFRILRSLTEERMLSYDESDKHYYLGPLLLELGLAAGSNGVLQERWITTIRQVARSTRLTTYLFAQAGPEVVCLACEQSSLSIVTMPVEIGQRLPLGIGGAGLALLSLLDDNRIERFLRSHLTDFEMYPWGNDAQRHIRDGAIEARRNGFAVSSGSVVSGIVEVAMAIPQTDSMTPLAVSVSAIEGSLDPHRIREIANEIQAAISAAPGSSRTCIAADMPLTVAQASPNDPLPPTGAN